jgi:hypothetical protein
MVPEVRTGFAGEELSLRVAAVLENVCDWMSSLSDRAEFRNDGLRDPCPKISKQGVLFPQIEFKRYPDWHELNPLYPPYSILCSF